MSLIKWCEVRAFVCVTLILYFCSCEQDIKSNAINHIDSKLSPLRINIKSNTNATKTERKDILKLVCPNKSIRVPFFAPSCKSSKDCQFLGKTFLCCNKRCITGAPLPKPEIPHSPMFGIIDRVCPKDPMPEFLPIKECTTDADCGIRICCPERPTQGIEVKYYCRNAAPRFNKMPAVKRMLTPLKGFVTYLQCTPPPPPFLDIFPRACERLFDCFPNLCCQENGKKFCRPPRKSLFALIVTSAQKVGSSEFAKNFIQRIS